MKVKLQVVMCVAEVKVRFQIVRLVAESEMDGNSVEGEERPRVIAT